MQIAERCSEDFALHMAQLARACPGLGGTAVTGKQGFDLLKKARSAAIGERFILTRCRPSICRPPSTRPDVEISTVQSNSRGTSSTEQFETRCSARFGASDKRARRIAASPWACPGHRRGPVRHRYPRQLFRPTPASCFTNCHCCGCGHCSRPQTATTSATGHMPIDTASWRKPLQFDGHLASARP